MNSTENFMKVSPTYNNFDININVNAIKRYERVERYNVLN